MTAPYFAHVCDVHVHDVHMCVYVHMFVHMCTGMCSCKHNVSQITRR